MRIRITLKSGQFHTTWWPASQIKILHHDKDKVVFEIPRWLAQKEALNINSIVPPMTEADKKTLDEMKQRLYYIGDRVLDQAERRFKTKYPKGDEIRAAIVTVATEVDTALENFPIPKLSIPILNQKVSRIETAVKALVNGPQPPSKSKKDDEVKQPPPEASWLRRPSRR